MSIETQLAKALIAFDNLKKKWNKKINDLRKELKVSGECLHSILENFEWESDDGYGTQSKHTGKRCTLCMKKNRWPGMSNLMSYDDGDEP